jgi:ribose transport system permease protein
LGENGTGKSALMNIPPGGMLARMRKEGGAPRAPGRRTRWEVLIQWIAWVRDQTGILTWLALLVVMLSIASPPFRRIDNFMLILLETAAIGVVAVGQTMVVLTGGIDLSVGSTIALTGVTAAMLMKQGIGPIPPINSYLAIIVALACGSLIGFGQGLLITKRKMSPFIVTLGSLSVLRGVALVVTNAHPINALPDDFKWVSDAYVGILPMPSFIMLLTFLVIGYMLRNTKPGRYAYAIGGNETSARLSGVPVDRYKIFVYMLSGFLSALAGITLIARIDSGYYTNGEGYELSSVAAVIIGGTSLSGGVGGVWGTLIGVLIMAVVRNGLVMLNISPLWHNIVSGSIILLAVFIDVERRRAQQSAPRVQIQPTTERTSYLDETVVKVAQLVKRRLGSPYTRIYLIDPQTDDLTECRPEGPAAARAGSIASQVRETGHPVILDNPASRPDGAITLLDSSIQSAMAIPLTSNRQIVGVIEVQSTAPHSFTPETVRQLAELNQEVTAPLRNAWLLECGWLARQTRAALRNLWDDVQLGRCPLAEWIFPGLDFFAEGGPAARGAQLRNLLLETMENLKSDHSQGDPRTVRRYDILRLTYVEGHTVNKVVKELNVSRRQYFYDQKGALDALAHMLVMRQATR